MHNIPVWSMASKSWPRPSTITAPSNAAIPFGLEKKEVCSRDAQDSLADPSFAPLQMLQKLYICPILEMFVIGQPQ